MSRLEELDKIIDSIFSDQPCHCEQPRDVYYEKKALAQAIHNSEMERVKGVVKEFKLLESYFEDTWEVVLHKNDINWQAIKKLAEDYGESNNES